MPRRIRWMLLIFALTLLPGCTPWPPFGPPAASSATYHAPDGTQMTALAVPPDEVAEIVGIERWKFQVRLPHPNLELRCRLELRAPDQPPVILTSTGLGAIPATQTDLLVALSPQAQPWSEAEQVQYYLKTDQTKFVSSIKNPFKASVSSSRSDLAVVQADGSFQLMTIQTENERTPGGPSQLVLIIEQTDED